MNLWEMIRVALEGIWANKLRSGLTMLGIIIGVLSVILVVTIAQGGQAKIMSQLESLGSNLFVVYVAEVEDGNYDKYMITAEDTKIIRASVDSIRSVVQVNANTATVKSRRKKESCRVTGTEADFATITNVEITQGRFFSDVDNAVSRRVVVINQQLADDLFGPGGDAIGQKITVGKIPMIVCGISANASNMFEGGQTNKTAYIPVNMFNQMFDTSGVWELEGSAVSKDKAADAAKQTIRILQLRHGDKDKKVYKSFNMDQEMAAANQITDILTMIIGAIAGISLLVGGIGVMNIMLVSVTERTREIGIRIAVGARRQDIMIQFLIEAIVISVVGGVIGMLLGMAGSAAICAALDVPFVVSVTTMLLAFVFSMIVGVFFGLYPANRAAKLDPIESLRYE